MKTKYFLMPALFFTLCLFSLSSMAQSGKPSYKVTIPGFPVITATDCDMVPTGANTGVITVTRAADNNDQQFQTDMKNKTRIASMDVVVYDGNGKQIKSFHFTGLVVKSVLANYQKISGVGFSYENETEK